MRPMARHVARAWARRLPPGVVQVDDLEQEAMAAICVAVQRWSPTGGASWPTYAQTRADGAIRDYLRRASFGGRNHWHEFSFTSLDAPIDDEQHTLADVLASDERPIEDFPDPRLGEQIERMLAALPLDWQTAVAMYHEDGLSCTQIGAAMGITESRVSQLLKAARERLEVSNARSRLGE